MSEFVFMLTEHDSTVPNALEVLDAVRDSGLRHIGFKDVGATPQRQRELTEAAHAAGLTVYLEVVSVSAEDELASVEAAVAAGVDWVLGGTYVDAALPVLAGTGISYAPFPGRVVGHPSVLEGTVEEIAADARRLKAKDGVAGVDLLAYRHQTANHAELIEAVAEAAAGRVIVAGSVVTEAQVRELTDAGAWGFTIGGAVFGGQLPGDTDVQSQVAQALRFAAQSRSYPGAGR